MAASASASKVRLAAALIAAATAAAAVPAAAGPTRARRARVAVRYLVSQQKPNGSIVAFSAVGSTADAAVAMVAARRAPRQIDRALDFLKTQVRKEKVAGVGPTAKVALAVVAGGRNPRKFARTNLIKAIRSTETAEGRYGEGTAVFDQALALLALRAAGARVGDAAIQWLVDAQCGDGGWQYDGPPGAGDDLHCTAPGGEDFFSSDTNTTALVVQALEAVPGEHQPAVDPFGFFAALRDEQFGGWGYSWSFNTTDANSTALVIQAHAAAGEELPAGARRSLRRLQYRLCGATAGAFALTWVDDGEGGFVKSGADVGATIGAIPGLLEKPLPISPASVTKPAPGRKAC